MPQGDRPLLNRKLRTEILYYRALLNATKLLLEAMIRDDEILLARGVMRRERAIRKIQRVEGDLSRLLGGTYPHLLSTSGSGDLKEHRHVLSLMLEEQLALDKDVEAQIRSKKQSIQDEILKLRARRIEGQAGYLRRMSRGVLLDQAS